MAREGNRVTETRPHGDRRPENRAPLDGARDRQDAPRQGSGQAGRRAEKEHRKDQPKRGQADQDEWLRKQKEDLKFQKETLEKAVDKEISGETGEGQTSHVTVKPGPRRPRGRRR